MVGPIGRLPGWAWEGKVDMTIQRFADLAKVTVVPYPFQMRQEALWPARDGYTFTKHDVDILGRAVGDTASIEKVELFLRTRCGFVAERDLFWLMWPRIVATVEGAIGGLTAPKSSSESEPSPEELRGEAQAMAVPIQPPTSTDKEIAKEAGVDPDLQTIIDRWPTVPKELRKAILRMIEIE